MTDPRMSVLDPAGPQADRIATLWDIFLYVAIAVWVLVALALAIGAYVSRRKNVTEPYVEPTHRDRNLVRGVIAAGVLTMLTLIGLLVASIATGSALADLEDDADALVIRVTGRQWWWDVIYAPDEPARTASTANELVVPVGRVFHLELEAADVIHSFWVPSLHGKKDLIPGRRNRTWLRIDEPGTYRGQCAEFCGLEHANMAITITAVPPAEFERWRDAQRMPAVTPHDEQAKRGREVFLASNCVLCHAIAGTTAGARLGPDLTHLASRHTLGASTLPNTEENLRAWITNPHRVKPYVRMPATALAPADLDALVAYLRTLR